MRLELEKYCETDRYGLQPLFGRLEDLTRDSVIKARGDEIYDDVRSLISECKFLRERLLNRLAPEYIPPVSSVEIEECYDWLHSEVSKDPWHPHFGTTPWTSQALGWLEATLDEIEATLKRSDVVGQLEAEAVLNESLLSRAAWEGRQSMPIFWYVPDAKGNRIALEIRGDLQRNPVRTIPDRRISSVRVCLKPQRHPGWWEKVGFRKYRGYCFDSERSAEIYQDWKRKRSLLIRLSEKSRLDFEDEARAFYQPYYQKCLTRAANYVEGVATYAEYHLEFLQL